MKKISPLLLLLCSLQSLAQKGLDEMIAAEKSFVAYAVANNTQEAFMKFIDTAAVMFDKGEPLNGYQLWSKRPKNAAVLNWRPRYAEIAASGDFGWTAGPWTYQPTKADSVIATGYYFTVWKKNSAGHWKFIVDVGTDDGLPLADTSLTRFVTEKTTSYSAGLLTAEKEYIALCKVDQVKAAQKFAARNMIDGRENGSLMEGNSSHSRIAAGAIKFTFLGTGIATSGDLGYAYGRVQHNGKKESYLRIWRHEPEGWKVALQMVRL